MRLNKRELSDKLGVSEATLTAWQRAGMPVLEHGSRGKPGVYDLAAVCRWMRTTGYGSRAQDPRHQVDLEALERELLALPVPPQPVQIPFPDSRTMRAIEAVQEASLVARAAWLVHLFGLAPLVALQCVLLVDGELSSAFEHVHGWDTGPNPKGEYFLAEYPDEAGPIVAKVLARVAELKPGGYGHWEHFFIDEEGNPYPPMQTSAHTNQEST